MIKLIKSTFFKEQLTKQRLASFITKADMLSIGDQCSEFEGKFGKWQGRKYCVLFNSGSSANLALIQSLLNLGMLSKGDRVAFGAITWSTNVMPIIQLGLKPAPIDIEIDTLNVSSEKIIESYKQEPFKCLFLTNLLGYSSDIDKIKVFCKKNKVILLEDNCEALGSEYKKIKLGNYGTASTFSFFAGHHLSTIEGGAVCTDDKKLNTMLRMVRSHGWDRHLSKKEQVSIRKQHKIDDFYSKYTFYDLGYNLRPTEIQGFLGLQQLTYLDEMIKKREKNYKKLEKIYSNSNFYKIDNRMSLLSNFAFPIICQNEKIKRRYIKKASNLKIEIRPIVGGLMTEQPFYKKYVNNRISMPNAELVNRLGFYFGNNPELTSSELSLLIKTFLNE